MLPQSGRSARSNGISESFASLHGSLAPGWSVLRNKTRSQTTTEPDKRPGAHSKTCTSLLIIKCPKDDMLPPVTALRTMPKLSLHSDTCHDCSTEQRSSVSSVAESVWRGGGVLHHDLTAHVFGQREDVSPFFPFGRLARCKAVAVVHILTPTLLP